jgi:energy-coupling factor transporter ATP-binding protein EcfA2
MITRIEALSYRCLRYVSQPLDRFHVLIGPNASGKTTFLDVVAFLGRLVSGGLDEAIGERTQNFQDLVWGRSGDSFELAIELEIPERLRQSLRDSELDTVRYEVAIAHDAESNTVAFRAETVLLKLSRPGESSQPRRFPSPKPSPETILEGTQSPAARIVINKVIRGLTSEASEATTSSRNRRTAFTPAPSKACSSRSPPSTTLRSSWPPTRRWT